MKEKEWTVAVDSEEILTFNWFDGGDFEIGEETLLIFEDGRNDETGRASFR